MDSYDKDVINTIKKRSVYSTLNKCAYDGSITDFLQCEKKYFDFFVSMSDEELQSILTIIPKGSLIFHGTPCRTTSRFPSIYSRARETTLTGTQQVLSEETIQKTIGTILFKMREDVADEPDEELKREIKKRYEEEIQEYKHRVIVAMRKGISVGKSFFWANTTIDANVMVDIRLMKSMICFIAKQDIVLIDYFKIFDYLEKKIDDIVYNENISYSHFFRDKDEMINNYKYRNPNQYAELWIKHFPIFKRSVSMPKSVTQNDYELDEHGEIIEQPGSWTDTIQTDEIMVKLRNMYKDTVGDSTFIQLLNYVLSLRGSVRLSGYADYDIADMTKSNILNGTNICSAYKRGDVTEGYLCKEIMLLNPTKYLAYIGWSEIQQFDVSAFAKRENNQEQ